MAESSEKSGRFVLDRRGIEVTQLIRSVCAFSAAAPLLRSRLGRLHRNVECEDRQNDLAIGIAGLGENITERSLPGCAELAFEEGVLWQGFTNLCKDSTEIGISIENKHGRFCVSPAQVGEELVECGN